MIKDNVQNKRSIIKKIKGAFIASLQDSRWPASHSLSENKKDRKSYRKKQVTERGSRMERGKDSYMSRKRHMTNERN